MAVERMSVPGKMICPGIFPFNNFLFGMKMKH